MITTAHLNHIRSPKALEGLKKLLTEFLAIDRAEVIAIYEHEYGWGEEDLDADIEIVQGLLEKVEHRAKSLGNYLAKADKNAPQPTSLPEDATAIPQSIG